ncbi:MAG: 3-hydroxyacyl-CoA dehydrogenase family protein [Oscillospiraceae bacterium]
MRIGVVGAGTMGAGIAQVFAACDGYDVVICDLTEELAERGRKNIETTLASRVARGRMLQATADAMMAKIATGTIEKMADRELVIEVAPEVMAIKKQTFGQLQEICGKDTIFASNTSTMSLTEISRGLDRPVVGMHFFNPAPVMKLVEVIHGMGTPDELIDRVVAIVEDIGKTPVVEEDMAGFVVNRILVPMINEAVSVLAEGLASAEDIDTAMKLGANFPMGPLELGDMVGLDICLAGMEVMHSDIGDPKYRPHPLLRKMVRAGRLGRKSGQGFYTYT